MTRYLTKCIDMIQKQYDVSDQDLLWLISLGASEDMKRGLIDQDDTNARRYLNMKFIKDATLYLSQGDDKIE